MRPSKLHYANGVSHQSHVYALVLAVLLQPSLQATSALHVGSAAELSAKWTAKRRRPCHVVRPGRVDGDAAVRMEGGVDGRGWRIRAARVATGSAGTARIGTGSAGSARVGTGSAGTARKGTGSAGTAPAKQLGTVAGKGDDRALAGLVGVLSLEGGGGAGAVVGRPSAVVAVVVDVGGHG